uniref:Uncharacterized protein n=1 Tax=Romanomermis culicivorax TaxID=13658 RepID=A0A915JUT7_ROMCU
MERIIEDALEHSELRYRLRDSFKFIAFKEARFKTHNSIYTSIQTKISRNDDLRGKRRYTCAIR